MTITTRTTMAPVVPAAGRLRPLGLDEVRITGGFWGDRQDTNRTATLPHIEAWLEREGWLGNFDLAASGALPAGRRGREFADSEVYKYLEALAWDIGRDDEPELERRFRAVVARVAAAQEEDGYLNTQFGRRGQGARWSDLEWGHELYCLGHLFQAAVARARTRPDADDGLLEIAVRAADLVCDTFGESGIRSVCGHAEVEVGLAELSRATGTYRYLEQARLFVDRRGQRTLADIEWGRSYYQDDVPLREASRLRGHAVRANYLAAGATDVAVDGADHGLLEVLRRQWDTSIARRTYVTGGQGSHHQDEAFGDDWELPPDRAYSETCAGIASVMFSWRLLLATGEERYADLIERTLYNVVATSPARDGRSFFYANTLHRREEAAEVDMQVVSSRPESSQRAPWFEVSCCPPNVARTLASLSSMIATADDGGIQLHQYTPSTIRTSLGEGRQIELAVETEYPRQGSVRIEVLEGGSLPWTLTLRVPAWARGAELRVTSAGRTDRRVAAVGYVALERHFLPGDVVELALPIAPRITEADRRVDAVRGCLVVERGPEVLCLESTDLPRGIAIDDVMLDATAPLSEDADGRTSVVLQVVENSDRDWPYARALARDQAVGGDQTVGAVIAVPLVAYHDWAERGPSTMRVFIPRAP